MCVAIFKPAGYSVSKATLRRCFQTNPDGAGFAFPDGDGGVVVYKGYWTARDFAREAHRLIPHNTPAILHCRIATHGEVDETNCHPHRLRHDLAFVHNGILSKHTEWKDPRSHLSDTIRFAKDMLLKLPKSFYRNTACLSLLDEWIGWGNKLIFLDGKGRCSIVNEKAGDWYRGCWYSNTSYKPRKAYDYGDSYYQREQVPEETVQKNMEKIDDEAAALQEYLAENNQEHTEGIVEFRMCGACECALIGTKEKQDGLCHTCMQKVLLSLEIE